MRAHRTAVRSLVLAAALALTSPAAAATPQEQAAAEALFNEGKRLVATGDVENGCKKLVESQRLDPTAGTGLNVGDCLEKQNKLASSWGAFKATEMMARDAGDTARQGEALRRAEALTPRLAKLAIVVPPGVAALPGLQVRRDGNIVGEGQYGSALPADVGFHSIEVSAPGYKAWSTGVRIETNGASASIEVQPLEKFAEQPPPVAPAPAWGTQRTIGVVLGAVGLVGLGIGSAFTVKMVGKNSDSLPYCQPGDVTKCSQTGVDLRNQAFDAAHVATGTFIAGGTLLAGGVIVFLTAARGASTKPDKPTARARLLPVAGPSLGGVALQGVW